MRLLFSQSEFENMWVSMLPPWSLDQKSVCEKKKLVTPED